MPTEKQARKADNAYLEGARAFDCGDFARARMQFEKAHLLLPGNAQYAAALVLAAQHHVSSANVPLPVQQWSEPGQALPASIAITAPTASNLAGTKDAGSIGPHGDSSPSRPALLGPIHFDVHDIRSDFHLVGPRRDVLRQALGAFGVEVVFDDSVVNTAVRFDLVQCDFDEVLRAVLMVTGTFLVPLNPRIALVVQDTPALRGSLEPVVYENVLLPEGGPEQIKDAMTVARSLLNIRQVTTSGNATLNVRAPEDTADTLNKVLTDIFNDSSEVFIEVRLMENTRTRTRKIGLQLPQQASVFNVDSEAAKLISDNQTVVSAAISAGLVKSGDTLGILELLVADGLADSSLTQLAGVFGNGITLTGLSFGTATFNLALNSSSSQLRDQIQMRLRDRETGTFHVGEKYPVTTSTYTVTSGTSVSGVNLSSLTAAELAALGLSSSSSSTSTTPQIQYEDLGVILTATPQIHTDGSVSLHVNLKIRSLAGTSINGIPVMNNREFTNDVTVGSGETAVMSSTVTNQESGAISGTPSLSEIPGFSGIASSKDKERDTQEVFLFLTPHVVRQRHMSKAGPMIPLVSRQAAPE